MPRESHDGASAVLALAHDCDENVENAEYPDRLRKFPAISRAAENCWWRQNRIGNRPLRASQETGQFELYDRAGQKAFRWGLNARSHFTTREFLAQSIALAFIERGRERMGEELVAASPLSDEYTRVRIVPPVFVDSDGERMKG